MNTFKRLIYTFKASVGQVVDDFENHQAVAEAAIQELEQLYAQTRVQHQRVARQANTLRENIEQAQREAEAWGERAAACRNEDEAKALECLRRRRTVRQRSESLEAQERETLKLKDKIAGDLQQLLAKLDELKRRKELLTSRQSQSAALSLVQGFGWDSASSVEALLDRWESRIEGARPLADDDGCDSRDDFASRFEKAELEAALKAELDALAGNSRDARDGQAEG